MMSENKSITTKLFQIQKEIGKITKGANNPFFKSKYYDINQLLEHTLPILQKNKVVILQPIINNEVYTVLRCTETGEEEVSAIPLSQGLDAQKKGSEITYFRRYTLASLLALQSDDDDGNSASNRKPQTPKSNFNSNTNIF
jgi:hypothetical protein